MRLVLCTADPILNLANNHRAVISWHPHSLLRTVTKSRTGTLPESPIMLYLNLSLSWRASPHPLCAQTWPLVLMVKELRRDAEPEGPGEGEGLWFHSTQTFCPYTIRNKCSSKLCLLIDFWHLERKDWKWKRINLIFYVYYYLSQRLFKLSAFTRFIYNVLILYLGIWLLDFKFGVLKD